MFDPIKLAEEIKKIVVRGDKRKYYRVARPGRWYGGIATADCVGCCLKCVFCWSGAPRDYPESIGKFYEPEFIAKELIQCARRNNYEQVRVSGNEPTLAKEHLLRLIEIIDKAKLRFILETNGILIGADPSYSRELSSFENLHVRVSLKGTNESEYSMLTGAIPETFNLQIEALKNLTKAGVSCHAAVMLSFSSRESLQKLVEKLRDIDDELADVEEEYVFLYPHVARRLKEAGIRPIISYRLNEIPKELI